MTQTLLVASTAMTPLAAVAVSTNSLPLSDDIKGFTAFVFCGAAFGMAFSYMLFDRQTTHRQTAARIIIAAVMGVSIPRLILKYVEWVKEFFNDPILVGMAGFICAFLSYYVVYSVFKKVAGKEAIIADAAIEAVKHKLPPEP